MLKSILCPVDFSEHSERALRYALDLAALTGGRVTLLSVTHPILDEAARASGNGDTAAEELRALAARVAGSSSGAPVVKVAVKVGEAAEEILKLAGAIAADLIVMGTQGMGAAERIMLGSTTEQVLRDSRVPVLAVPPPPER